MPAPAHHRLSLHTPLGPLPFALDLTLTAPWTTLFAPSGTGKTTLLRLIAGLLPAVPATFERFSPTGWLPLHHLSPERRALAYAPQNAALFPHLTVHQNVSFAHSLRHATLPTRRNKPGRTPPPHQADVPVPANLVPEAMALFNLHPLADRLPHQLSGGQRQLVSLARALATPHAHLLLLDEPFAGIDRPLRDTLLPRLQATLAARHLPVLSVTHAIDEALLTNAEVLRLQNGQVTAQGPAPQVLAPELQSLATLLQRSE